MNSALSVIILVVVLGCGPKQVSSQLVSSTLDSSRVYQYLWLENYSLENKLINRIATPQGYERTAVQENSFAGWLRNLPLMPGNPSVHLYDGSKKFNQRVHVGVIDIDVGHKDLQQCADAVMRLRGEYLYSNQYFNAIHFNFTNGFNCDFTNWTKGNRPIVNGNKVAWQKTQSPASDHKTFRQYMDRIFMYCGTQSLSQEMKSKSITTIEGGDVFIRGGFPGHAVIVLDVAVHPASGERIFLLAQSYMPAQEMHVLVNPENSSLSPWYSNNILKELVTPEWTFSSTELKEF